jgi:hypothetical protein
VQRIQRVVHGQRPAPDSFQQTSPGHAGGKPRRREGTTTSDPTVLDESGRYAPVTASTSATPMVGHGWLLWVGAAVVLTLIGALALLLRQNAKDEVVHNDVVVSEPAPSQQIAPEVSEHLSDLASPASAENPEASTPAPAPPGPAPPTPPAPSRQPRPALPRGAAKPPASALAPRPASGALLDEATESRK